VSASREKT